MPTFDFTSPDGRVYSVQGPEGATEAQAFEILQSQIGAQKPVESGGGSSVSGVAKSLGTGLAEGVIGLAGLPGDLYNLAFGESGKESDYGAASFKKQIEAMTGPFYKPQGVAENLAHKAGEFAPALIGGPETLAVKLATRVAVPTVASEVGREVAGPYGEVGGALLGAAGGTVAARRFQEMAAARKAAQTIPSADDTIKAAKGQFKSAEDMNLVVTPDFATTAATNMRNALKGFDPEAQGAVFKAADRLEGLIPPSPVLAAGKSPAATVAAERPSVVQPSAGEEAPPSLLQFIASKGGLQPNADLEAIGLARGHRAQIPGRPGFFGVVSNRGTNLDRMREAAEEAGYLQGNHWGTSTISDLLDAIDAEMRGQKRYPAGYEGARTRRESALMSEREQHAFDSYNRGFDEALNEAGHGQVSPDVRKRAVQLMEREGMDADTAVDHAILQLDQEDAVARFARPPRPETPAFLAGFPPDIARGVPMNDVELIRKQLTNLKMSTDAPTREAARKAIASLQDSQTALVPAQVLRGDAGQYSSLMRDAIGNYAAGKRSNTVMGKVALGDLNAATAGSGANEDNALRQAIKQLVRPVNNDIVPKASRLGFNAEEIAAMNRVARGTATGNTARFLGKLAPTGSVSGVLSGGAGFAAAGPMGAIGLPAAGYIAKKIGDLSTKKAVQALDSLVRSNSPLARQVAATLPPHIVQSLPARTKLLLGATALQPVFSQPVPANR